MRTLRGLVVGVLVGAGLAVLAPGAIASVPAASKTCRSLTTLNSNLEKAFKSGDSGKFNAGSVATLSKSFRKAAKTGPKSLKSAMNAIADVAASVSHANSPLAAAGVLRSNLSKLVPASTTWATYLEKKCSTVPSTT
jgi:hypothetical protein